MDFKKFDKRGKREFNGIVAQSLAWKKQPEGWATGCIVVRATTCSMLKHGLHNIRKVNIAIFGKGGLMGPEQGPREGEENFVQDPNKARVMADRENKYHLEAVEHRRRAEASPNATIIDRIKGRLNLEGRVTRQDHLEAAKFDDKMADGLGESAGEHYETREKRNQAYQEELKTSRDLDRQREDVQKAIAGESEFETYLKGVKPEEIAQNDARYGDTRRILGALDLSSLPDYDKADILGMCYFNRAQNIRQFPHSEGYIAAMGSSRELNDEEIKLIDDLETRARKLIV